MGLGAKYGPAVFDVRDIRHSFKPQTPLSTFWQNIINKIKISRRFLNKKVLHYVVDIFKGISHVAFHILANNLHNPAFNPIAK